MNITVNIQNIRNIMVNIRSMYVYKQIRIHSLVLVNIYRILRILTVKTNTKDYSPKLTLQLFSGKLSVDLSYQERDDIKLGFHVCR